jgi:hypothetical protein
MRLGSGIRISALVGTTCLLAAHGGGGGETAGRQFAAGIQTEQRVAINAGDLVGTWTLLSIDERRPNGDIVHREGSYPRGLIIYDRTGNMSVQIMRDPPPPFSSNDAHASFDELRSAYRGYHAYFGTYDVDERERTVTHHVRGSMRPFEVGKDYRRSVRLVDDRLILSLSETRSLTWRRLR